MWHPTEPSDSQEVDDVSGLTSFFHKKYSFVCRFVKEPMISQDMKDEQTDHKQCTMEFPPAAPSSSIEKHDENNGADSLSAIQNVPDIPQACTDIADKLDGCEPTTLNYASIEIEVCLRLDILSTQLTLF